MSLYHRYITLQYCAVCPSRNSKSLEEPTSSLSKDRVGVQALKTRLGNLRSNQKEISKMLDDNQEELDSLDAHYSSHIVFEERDE